MLCSLAALWGIAAELIFKTIFGRVPPGYIQGHALGFHLLAGRPPLASFPSGTATISTASVAVLWILAPRSRIIGALIALLRCAAVGITNSHGPGARHAGLSPAAAIGWLPQS